MDFLPADNAEQKEKLDLIHMKEETPETVVEILGEGGRGGGGVKSGGSFADSANTTLRLLCLHGRVGFSC